MQKTSISPIDVCVTNYKSRKYREKVDPFIIITSMQKPVLQNYQRFQFVCTQHERLWINTDNLPTVTVLFTKPPAGGRNDLRDRSPVHGFRVFQELYQAKPGTALLAAL